MRKMDQVIREKLEKWLDDHFEELIRDVEKLVAIGSVSEPTESEEIPFGEGCRKALDAALEMAKGYGFETRNYENRCGSVSLRPAEEEIAFWGHLDVVPPADGWLLTEPFKPVRMGDYLIGRGSDDNKGPAVGVMYLLRAFEELKIPTKHGLRLFLGCDEESGMRDVKYYTEHYAPSKMTIIPDCGFPVCYGEKGIISADIVSDKPVVGVAGVKAGLASNIIPAEAMLTLKGENSAINGEWVKGEVKDGCTVLHATGLSRHSAFPEGGVNAIHEATKAACQSGLLSDDDRKILEFFTRVNDDYLGTELGIAGSDETSGYTTCAGTMMFLRDDGRLVLHLNIRYHIWADQAEMLESMERICKNNGCTLEHVHASKGNYFPRENPVVDAMTAVFNEITNGDAKPYVMGGGTYARGLVNALGFGLGGLPKEPTDLFAPGHGGAHQPDEGLHLGNLKKALLIFGMGILEADRMLGD